MRATIAVKKKLKVTPLQVIPPVFLLKKLQRKHEGDYDEMRSWGDLI